MSTGNDSKVTQFDFEELVGTHPLMQQLYQRITVTAATQAPVIIEGETGVGKELVVRALHRRSGLPGRLVAINVAALPEHLAEAELFGVARGAYTGAVERRGLIEEADGGTLYLDEGSDAAMGLQAKLLRVLENNVVRRMGCHRDRPVQVRLIISTQQGALDLVRRQRWRPDFYYRVGGMHLPVPALRDHPSDLSRLVNHFLGLAHGVGGLDAVLPDLCAYQWPGNVRELKRLVERSMINAMGGRVTGRMLLEGLAQGEQAGKSMVADVAMASSWKAVYRRHVLEVLETCEQDTRRAAHALGLSRSGLYYQLRRLGIVPPRRIPEIWKRVQSSGTATKKLE